MRSALATLLLASAAFAQAPAPTVTPFPLDVKRTPSNFSKQDTAELQKEFMRLVRKYGAMVPDSATYDVALKELKRQDCEREDECLKQLAQKGATLYAVYASVDYTLEGKVVSTGRVVRDDGVVVSKLETVELPKGRDAFKDVAIVALSQLLQALNVKSLPAVRAVTPPDAPKKDTPPDIKPDQPPPPPPPLVVHEGMRGRAVAQYGLLIGGGVVAVTGAVVAGLANATTSSLTIRDGTIAEGDLEKWRAARSQETVGWVLTGAGAAAVVAGAVLLLTDTPPPVTVAPVASGGGGGVVLQGTF